MAAPVAVPAPAPISYAAPAAAPVTMGAPMYAAPEGGMPMMGARMAQPMPAYSAPIASAPNFTVAPAQYYTSPAPVSAMQTAAASCPNCGNVYLDDSIFCRMCGTKRVGGGPMDMFSQLDVNGDGQLSSEEFAAFANRAY
eukprot:TRINITY_DN3029_c0_g2_i1.p1 TRINITY_DN3029_c0_g2~~TRINITY_DN3029_c0_g2_i1.p1  ORF type:complete len:140 (+),score=16.52 TRINITY_DN3029_c0_g2_i1:2-421(+)